MPHAPSIKKPKVYRPTQKAVPCPRCYVPVKADEPCQSAGCKIVRSHA
jgi:hypothetical protein